MSFHENQQGKIKRLTSKQAVSLAMEGRWQEAIEVNKAIIEKFPNDVEACNRLGKAYLETGEYALAKTTYQKALELDQYNTIAKKNIQRLELLGSGAAAPSASAEKAVPNLFIEEIGKAGVVILYQIAPSDRLVKMMAGDKVFLKPQDSSLVVMNVREEYLGLVPTKFAHRLLKLIAGGNKYTCVVVNSNENAISVIIRETYQDPSQIDQVSFPGRKLEEIQPFAGDHIFASEIEGEDIAEGTSYGEESTESSEEVIEETIEEDKDWEQEA
jgi:tetratricopeptide (TPR) repeat protein